MLRNILGAVGGYIVMAVIAMAGIAIAWFFLRGSGAFEGEGPAPSTLWLTINVLLGLVAAVAGGWAAARVGRSATAVKILIGLVLVLGAYIAMTAGSSYEKREPVNKTVAEMSFVEAGRHARPPAWYNWVIPLVGAASAWFGGRHVSAAPGSP